MNSSQLSMSSVRGRVLHADADDVLVVLLELGDQRREVAVARQDHEGVQVLLGVGEVHRVHDHLDVGAVLARVVLLRDVDQLDGRLVEGALVVAVALPVGVGLLDDDLALLQEALQDQLDVELADVGVADAERDVLEVAEHGDLALVGCRALAVGDGDDDLAGRPIRGRPRGWCSSRCRGSGRRPCVIDGAGAMAAMGGVTAIRRGAQAPRSQAPRRSSSSSSGSAAWGRRLGPPLRPRPPRCGGAGGVRPSPLPSSVDSAVSAASLLSAVPEWATSSSSSSSSVSSAVSAKWGAKRGSSGISSG